MIKHIESKSKQKNDKHTERFLNKKKVLAQVKPKQDLEHPKTAKIHSEKQQLLTLQTQRSHKSKQLKPKKIKFITEQFQKSNHFLSPPSKINGQSQSLRLSSHDQANNDNAYQLMHTFKKAKKGEGQLKKSRKQSQEIDPGLISYKMAHVSKIKKRKPQNQSKSRNSLCREVTKPSKSGNKNVGKTSSQGKEIIHNKKKQFLSPEIVQQQDSYYFDSHNQERHHSEYPGKNENFLKVPQKPSLLLFDSNGSVWKQKQNIGRSILRSTLDLLN